MSAKCRCHRLASAALGATLFFVIVPRNQADTVKLNAGGSVTGGVVAGPLTSGTKTVAVRTPTGGLIVLDKGDVKEIKRARTP